MLNVNHSRVDKRLSGTAEFSGRSAFSDLLHCYVIVSKNFGESVLVYLNVYMQLYLKLKIIFL